MQAIKLRIQKKKGYHAKNQKLMFSGLELRDNKTMKALGFKNGVTLRLKITSDAQELGLAIGGTTEQKIYADDDENFDMYNVKKVTRVFVNIANGNMWKAITNKELPTAPLEPEIYKEYGYPWFDLYDAGINELQTNNNFSNIKSIKEIEYDPNKSWNCPKCTFENLARSNLCEMCFEGNKPTIKEAKEKAGISIDKNKVIVLRHPDAVDEGHW